MFASTGGQSAGQVIAQFSEGFLDLIEGPIPAIVTGVVGVLAALAVIWVSFIAWRKFKEASSKV